MPCYHPLLAWKCTDGQVVFVERQRYDIAAELSLPCGQCIGCRLERSRQWAMRCVHEATLYKSNAFVTLTYEEANLPARGQLVYADFQKFMKRLRREYAPNRVRFYMCGEYGELGRPHYHACLFNVDFWDKEYWSKQESGAKLYRSKILERLWPYGFTSIGDVNFETAGYVARYCMKKMTGFNARYHYYREDEKGGYQLIPEFNKMSLKPGIGKEFLEKWEKDIYPHDYVIINEKKTKPPKYYDKIWKADNEDAFEEMQLERERKGRERYEDNTESRLLVKEEVQEARIRTLKRKL